MLDTLIYTSSLFAAEYELAHYIVQLVKQGCDKIAPRVDGLKHKQPEAVEFACNHSFSVLGGPAGTGKTTTIRQIIDSFDHAGMRGVICCHAGKAANRASEVVNAGRGEKKLQKILCTTVHGLLKFEFNYGGFTYNSTNKLPSYDYIICDEYPTLSCELARDLVSAIDPETTRLVFSGDPFQLPSIDPGNLGHDLRRVKKIPTVILDVVLRHGAKSGIAINANQILRGQPLRFTDDAGVPFTDFFFVQTKSELDSLRKIIEWVSDKIPKKHSVDPIKDIQVISPGKKSTIGTENISKELRQVINKTTRELWDFKIGDKVICNQTTKSLGITNGEIGVVHDIAGSNQSNGILTVDFGGDVGKNDNGLVELKSENRQLINLAHALTVHKMQGSETKICIMPLHQCHHRLLNRNMLYTGETRAREVFVGVGEKNCLEYAIANNTPSKRRSRLTEIITKMLG